MIASKGLIVDSRVKLDEAHYPLSIELQIKDIGARCSQLLDEEVLSIEADAIEDIKTNVFIAPSSFAAGEYPLTGHRVRLII